MNIIMLLLLSAVLSSAEWVVSVGVHMGHGHHAYAPAPVYVYQAHPVIHSHVIVIESRPVEVRPEPTTIIIYRNESGGWTTPPAVRMYGIVN
jgi:hypothetical protein